MSFQKRKAAKSIPGTRSSVQNGQLLCSSGNPSLDQIIGGGLPIGSILLIEEDKFITYSKVLCKYFLAEGVFSGHSIFCASLDDDPTDLMKKLPVPVETPSTSHGGPPSANEAKADDLRIAWRYNDLPQINSEQSTVHIGHNFDLTKQVTEETLELVDKTYWSGTKTTQEESHKAIFENSNYPSLLTVISKKAQEPKFSISDSAQSDDDKSVLRICISSLGSPLWYSENIAKELLKFLTILKSIVRKSLAVCCVTIPTHLVRHLDEKLVYRIRNLVDFCVELEAFAGSDKETNPAFNEYNGLLHIRRIVALNCLAVFTPETTDLAFKLRRKKFVIEKLHLPPELQDSDQREQDDIVPSTSCASGKKNLLEF